MGSIDNRTVDQFILEEIDTVPHLEALLLIWNSRPVQWSPPEMAERLFVDPGIAERILQDLANHNLIVPDSESKRYKYLAAPGNEELLTAVDQTYRRELVRISRLIHSQGSASIRQFARAFRIKKD
jgi:hypothetical protein